MKAISTMILGLLMTMAAYAQVNTCNAKNVAVGQAASCTVTLTSAQILAFDGTTATEVQAITAPGSNKAIWIHASDVYAVYNAGSYSYTSAVWLDFAVGQWPLTGLDTRIDLTQTQSQVEGLSSDIWELPKNSYKNQALSVYGLWENDPATGGTGTITLTIPFTVIAVN